MKILNFVFLYFLCFTSLFAKIVEYKFDIAYKEVQFTEKKYKAISVGGCIPAPKIEAQVGDLLRVTFVNKLDKDSSVHWHGILLPNNQDGVPFLTTPTIKPNTTFTYEFPVIQSGTYWYHSHTGFQEQLGVYGPIVFHPKKNMQNFGVSKKNDHTVVLSDWNNADPHKVYKQIKFDKDYFAKKKDSVQSWLGVFRNGKKALTNKFQNSWDKMSPMDISDFSYETFLANGKKESNIVTNKNENLRIRLINSASSTFFNVEFALSPVWIIALDGVDIKPILVKRFKITNAETYDLIIKIPKKFSKNNSYELRFTAEDGSGYSSVFIGNNFNKESKILAPTIPKPNLYLISHNGHANHDSHESGSGGGHDTADGHVSHDSDSVGGHDKINDEHNDSGHANHDSYESGSGGGHDTADGHVSHDSDSVGGHDKINDEHNTSEHSKHLQNSKIGYRGGNPNNHSLKDLKKFVLNPKSKIINYLNGYNEIESISPTNLDNNAPINNVKLKITGSMERFIWSFDNRTLSNSKDIIIHKGERVFFNFENTTMMQHPIHLHGHFFRVLNGKNNFSPLKHTVNIKPFSKVTIEFYADQEKNWFMHCHILYHMMAGMARVVRYEENGGVDNKSSNTKPFIKNTFDKNKIKNLDKNLKVYSNTMKEEVESNIKIKKFQTPLVDKTKNFDKFDNFEKFDKFDVTKFKKMEMDSDWHTHFIWDLTQNMTRGNFRSAGTYDSINSEIDFGFFNKVYEANLFYERNLDPISRFWDIYFGVNADRKDDLVEGVTRGMIGTKYILPLFLVSNFRFYTDKEFEFGLSSNLQLTTDLRFEWEWRYKTKRKASDFHLALLYLFKSDLAFQIMYTDHYFLSLGIRLVFL